VIGSYLYQEDELDFEKKQHQIMLQRKWSIREGEPTKDAYKRQNGEEEGHEREFLLVLVIYRLISDRSSDYSYSTISSSFSNLSDGQVYKFMSNIGIY